MNCFVFHFILVLSELVPALLVFYDGAVNTVDAVPAHVPSAYLSKTSQSFHVSLLFLYFSAWGHSQATGGNLACMSESEVQAQEQHQLMRRGNLWARPAVSSPFMEQLWVVFQKFYQMTSSGNGLQSPKGITCSNGTFINVSSLISSVPHCASYARSDLLPQFQIYPLFPVLW